LYENESPSGLVDYDLGFVSRVHGRSIVNVALLTPQRAFHRNLLKNSFESRNASTIETPETSLRALRSFYGILTRFIFAPRDHLTFFNKFLEKSIAR
jgi:hypothetical protein